jgi:hypothetical protein
MRPDSSPALQKVSMTNPDNDALAQTWYEHKTRLMEGSLGPEHDVVMHAIIPYAVGGALDLYYYPRGFYPYSDLDREPVA